MSTTVVRPVAPAPAVAGRLPWLAPLRAWHLVSLDAPVVAALWLLAFCAGQSARTRWVEAAALLCAVWLLYAADRLLDAAKPGASALQARHWFHARHRVRFAAAALVVLGTLGVLMAWLPGAVLKGWLWLAIPLALYALAVHCGPAVRLPKELAVATMFAVATTLPALLTLPVSRAFTVPLGVLFGAVCWLNCVGIARWEAVGPGEVNRSAPSTLWGARHFRPLCLVVASVGLLACVAAGPLALLCAASAVLLLLLDSHRNRLDAVAVRALADAALLTPVLYLLAR